MNGWIIVYMPGGDVYEMFDDVLPESTFKKRLLRTGIRTFLAAAQLWWWVKT